MEPQARFERAASSLPRKRSNQAELLGLANSVLEELEIKLSARTYVISETLRELCSYAHDGLTLLEVLTRGGRHPSCLHLSEALHKDRQ